MSRRVNVRTQDGVVHDARDWRTRSTACGLVVHEHARRLKVHPSIARQASIVGADIDCIACISARRTPYAVLCDEHGQRFLTVKQYDHQMSRPDSLWMCPVCGDSAYWDDGNYEEYLDAE